MRQTRGKLHHRKPGTKQGRWSAKMTYLWKGIQMDRARRLKRAGVETANQMSIPKLRRRDIERRRNALARKI